MTVPHVSGDESQYLRKDDVGVYHRRGLTDCPWCGYEFVESKKHSMEKYNIWYENPWIKEVVLNNTYYKVGCVVVVSKCPECMKLSWLHRHLDTMAEMFDEKSLRHEGSEKLRKPLNIDAIRQEMHNRGMKSVNEMLSAICHKCTHFKGILKHYDTFWYHKFICGRENEERERSIHWFQNPDDCDAYQSSTPMQSSSRTLQSEEA